MIGTWSSSFAERKKILFAIDHGWRKRKSCSCWEQQCSGSNFSTWLQCKAPSSQHVDSLVRQPWTQEQRSKLGTESQGSLFIQHRWRLLEVQIVLFCDYMDLWLWYLCVGIGFTAPGAMLSRSHVWMLVPTALFSSMAFDQSGRIQSMRTEANSVFSSREPSKWVNLSISSGFTL